MIGRMPLPKASIKAMTQSRLLAIALAGILICSVCIIPLGCKNQSGESKNRYPGLEEFIDSLLTHYIEENPGIKSAALLVEGPGISHRIAAGMADPAQNIPMSADDQFYLASTSKMMTATIIMKYVEGGVIKLDDCIEDYLPDSILQGLHTMNEHSYEGEITIRQLLNHTAGLADAFHDDGFIQLMIEQPDKFWHPAEVIAYVKENLAPYFPPGTGWKYSDMHYNLLGLLIEKLSEKSLSVAFRELLFDPLGMNDTYRRFFEEPRRKDPSRQPSRWFRGDFDCSDLRSITADWAGGGLYSTVEDSYRFLHAFVESRVFTNPATRDTMLQWIQAMEGVDYGLGIIRVPLDMEDSLLSDAGDVWGHQGASSAFMYYWPQKQVYFCGTFNQMQYEGLGFGLTTDICRFVLRNDTGG
jgi:D-alanyl-D-alanine carboxypeptidase